ncbi:uncharacterized protein LOC127725776 isoform X2 [Mytilus californianus]|uniref:uncharacterized protein LOC127725776 isoform X2 n=1 Tax=Mytilus californianus TaxID=6549 RepID=UPI0022468221|nr:uncharacterized protein LOC127725776 isoform X2 [Mytilus californianus]
MEGIRISFSVIFLISVWTVLTDLSNAHQGQMIVTKQSMVQVPENKDDNKCMALLRRTVIRKELLTYPCFHPVPGVVPVVAHQTPMGLVCRGYTNSPSTQYIRLPTCCPGFQPDKHGHCIRRNDMLMTETNQKHHQDQQQGPKRLEDLEEYPASYEKKRQQTMNKVLSQPKHWAPHPMIMRRIDAILKQRQHFLRQMQKDMTKPTQKQLTPASLMNGLFPDGPHRLLGQQQSKSVPEIPRQPEQAVKNHQQQKPMHQHHNQMHHDMSHAFHSALHKHNIPHEHDKQGNPQMHANQLKSNNAFVNQQNMQMSAKNQMQMTRQQQLFQLQQQRQRAMDMRQRMLHHRRMLQQAQAQRHQHMMMQKLQNNAQQGHRQMPVIPTQQQSHNERQTIPPFVIRRQYVSNAKQFPNVPQMRASVMMAISPHAIQHFFQQTSVRGFPKVPTHHMNRYPVQLPRIPVETPPVSIRPGPNSPFSVHPPPECFSQYMMVVKKCFQEANIQIPLDHNMFNVNYNYNGVCQNREMIIACIFNHLSPCNSPQEQHLVKATIGHTVDEMNRFCQIGQINGIEERMGGRDERVPMNPDHLEQPMDNVDPVPEPVQEVPIIPEDHHAISLGQHTLNLHAHKEKVAQIDEYQGILPEAPVPENVIETKSDVTISEHKDSQNVIGTAHAHTHDDDKDREHEVHMMELQEEQYYLPILIGTAIGVAGIFVLLLAIFCICYRRRLQKKIYLEKETEKPKLFDVYTIGVPPPVYEVNGIPPISYEEAKGEKFTGSPTSVRRHNAENEYQQPETGRKSGVVSDI